MPRKMDAIRYIAIGLMVLSIGHGAVQQNPGWIPEMLGCVRILSACRRPV